MTKLTVILGLCAGAAVVKVDPLSQVIDLLQDLHTTVKADAAAELEAFKTFSQWCKEQVQDDFHQHETLSSNIASTKAAIGENTAKVASTSSDIASLASQIAS